VRTRLRIPLDASACSRGLAILSVVTTIMAIVLVGRITVFMVNSERAECSFIPSSPWEVHHSCVSAYFVAARAAHRVPNIYADSLYTSRDDDPTRPRKALTIGRFNIDVYEYPPPFLLVPRAMALAVPDFDRFRTVWFGLNGLVILVTLLTLARLLGPIAGTRVLLLSPLVWIAPATLSVLQKGNVQALIVAISVLAMVAFQRRRWATGGPLLAYAIASKLFPGLLLVYLAVQRRWRAVLWTSVCGVVLVALTWTLLGGSAYAAFLAHLPGLLGGEAFPAFRHPMSTAINVSIPGLVFKLKLFGVPGMGFAAAKVVGWIYTLILVVAIVLIARRPVSEARAPLVWLAILTLASLRSPFLPQAYAAFPPLVLLIMLGALAPPTRTTLAAVLLTWLALGVYWPQDKPADPRGVAALNVILQLAIVGVAIAGLRAAREGGSDRFGNAIRTAPAG
jgi:hypothetical protein